jgi:hypothetical protein
MEALGGAGEVMLVQDGVDGVLKFHHTTWQSNDSPHREPLLGVAANAGSSSLPPGRDSPGLAVMDELLSQQMADLLRQHRGRWIHRSAGA